MSQIFDALHQNASERGNGAREFSAAKELLQVVERRNSSSTTAVAEPDPLLPTREIVREFPPAKVALPEASRFVCFGQGDTLAAEKFRFLATRLRHLQQKRSIKRLVVTSSVVGEGKSMVAANLACALALGKQQVLLVEGDLRRPSLGAQLGLRELSGLTQVLQIDGENHRNIYRLEGSGLCVLLAGAAHRNPLEFMDPGKLSTVLDDISQGFDWVVIDSPPVLPLADTSIWIRLSDAILVVTRPGITPKKQLQRSFEAIEQFKLLGTVLNASSETTTNHYYYHYTARADGSQHLTQAAK